MSLSIHSGAAIHVFQTQYMCWPNIVLPLCIDRKDKQHFSYAGMWFPLWIKWRFCKLKAGQVGRCRNSVRTTCLKKIKRMKTKTRISLLVHRSEARHEIMCSSLTFICGIICEVHITAVLPINTANVLFWEIKINNYMKEKAQETSNFCSFQHNISTLYARDCVAECTLAHEAKKKKKFVKAHYEGSWWKNKQYVIFWWLQLLFIVIFITWSHSFFWASPPSMA